ncbi:hypothetical protein EDD86DRAFT_211166 [Gorgonomyces haynaldii]|nr:hypothetical protein EDD86DRAFT_211166 [Gorgonomyces haynaldii]
MILEGAPLDSIVSKKQAPIMSANGNECVVLLDKLASCYSLTDRKLLTTVQTNEKAVGGFYTHETFYIAFQNQVQLWRSKMTSFAFDSIIAIFHAGETVVLVCKDKIQVCSTEMDKLSFQEIQKPDWCKMVNDKLYLVYVKENVIVQEYVIKSRIILEREFEFVPETKPKAFAVSSKHLFVHYDNVVVGHGFDSDDLRLAVHGNNLQMLALETGHLFVCLQSKELSLMLFDTIYGTLQSTQTIQTDLPLDVKIDFSLALAKEEIVVGTSAMVSKRYKNVFTLFPYYTKQVQLLDCIKKLPVEQENLSISGFKAPVTSVIQVSLPTEQKDKQIKNWKANVISMADMDTQHLQKLLDPKETPTETEFISVFQDWLHLRSQRVREYGTKVRRVQSKAESRSMLHLSLVQLPPNAAPQLAERMFSNPHQFWPRKVIEYCLQFGYIRSSNCPPGLIKSILLKQDLTLLVNAIGWIADITPAEFAMMIKYVCAEQDSEKRHELMEDAVEAPIRKKNDRLRARSEGRILEPEELYSSPSHPQEYILSRGQHYFLGHILQKLLSTPQMHDALSGLEIGEIDTLLLFVKDSMGPDFDERLDAQDAFYPLWFLWSPDKTQYEKWAKAVHLFELILDSSFTKILLNEHLVERVQTLNKIVKRDRELVNCMNRLRGPMAAALEQQKSAKSQGRRWSKLLEEVQNGVGEYAVEALVIRS